MPTESRFPSARNSYSHPNGMSIHIDRNTQDVKLDKDEDLRPELALGGFNLSDRVCRLSTILDKVDSGSIRHIEGRAGIPRRVLVESHGFGGRDLRWGPK